MRALIVVDVQKDFVSGSLAVPGAASIIPVINQMRGAFELVVFTKDWHPPGHSSFALWPVHCLQGEPGAEFADGLDTRGGAVFVKGTDPATDSYSGFSDNDRRKSTGLEEFLKTQGVTDVFICGLATDYCVKATALDAVRLGFKAHLIEDACRGVNRQPGDVEKALEEMRAQGVATTSSFALHSQTRKMRVN